MPTPPVAMDLAPAMSTTTASTRTVEKPREGLVIAGAVTLGTTYLLTAGFAGLSSLGMAGHKSGAQESYYAWMLLPLLGPWVSLGYAKGNNATGMALVAITSGTLQTIGAGLITLGLTWKTKTVVPTSVAQVELAPLSDGTGLAIRVVGF